MEGMEPLVKKVPYEKTGTLFLRWPRATYNLVDSLSSSNMATLRKTNQTMSPPRLETS